MAGLPRMPPGPDPGPPGVLTPLRAHYLKKALVQVQIDHELALLNQKDALAALGPPFIPAPQAPIQPEHLPFLRFAFQHFLLPFPMIKSSASDFFPQVQKLADEFYSRQLSSSDDREEPSQRRKIANRVERHLTTLFSSAILAKPPPGVPPAEAEQVVDLTLEDRQRITVEEQAGAKAEQDVAAIAINIIAVRTLTSPTGRKPDVVTPQFIVASSTGKGSDETYVARSYPDFEHLKITLQQEVGPLLEVPEVPFQEQMVSEETITKTSRSLSDRLFGLNLGGSSSGSGSSSPSRGGVGTRSPTTTSGSGKIVGEANRQTLRAYLRDLVRVPQICQSDALQQFLHAAPVQLTETEILDASVRADLDVQRETASATFAQTADIRAAELRSLLAKLKYEVSQPEGLITLFNTFRNTTELKDLPDDYRSMAEWTKMSIAASLYTSFIGSDNGPATFASFSKITFLMPFTLLKQVFRITSPAAMIRGVLNIFLVQPLGSKSLLQRMYSSSFAESSKFMQTQASSAATKIDDSLLVQKLGAYVHLSPTEQAKLKSAAQSARLPLPVVVLTSPICGPALSPVQSERVEAARVSRAKGEFTGPSTLLDQFHALMVAQLKMNDFEQLESLVAASATGELFKDLVSIFVTPLAEVYRDAHASDFVGDAQSFCDDLVQTVKTHQARKPSTLWSSCVSALTIYRGPVRWQSPTAMLQVFQSLMDRHQDAIYHFLHETQVHGHSLFGGLIEYFQHVVNFLQGTGSAADKVERRGIGDVDLEALLPVAGDPQRESVFRDIDALIHHAYTSKWLREVRLRRHLAAQCGQGSEGNSFGHSVLGFTSTSVGDRLEGDPSQVAWSDQSNVFEKGGIPDARLLPLPELYAIPSLVPTFVELVRPMLEQTGSKMTG